jgi:hypothetical protein
MTEQEPTEPVEPITQQVPVWDAQSRPVVVEGGASGVVVGAGVILLVIAALVGIFSLFALLAGAMMGQMTGLSADSGLTDAQLAVARVFVLVIGGIGLALAVTHLISGIGVLRRRGWARILGLVLSVLGVLIWGLALAGSLAAATQPIPAGYLESSGLTIEQYRSFARLGSGIGLVVTGLALASYLFILVVLARRGREFA